MTKSYLGETRGNKFHQLLYKLCKLLAEDKCRIWVLKYCKARIHLKSIDNDMYCWHKKDILCCRCSLSKGWCMEHNFLLMGPSKIELKCINSIIFLLNHILSNLKEYESISRMCLKLYLMNKVMNLDILCIMYRLAHIQRKEICIRSINLQWCSKNNQVNNLSIGDHQCKKDTWKVDMLRKCGFLD